MFGESASLVLKTSDLTAGTTNQIGSADTYMTNMTWNNINLRTILGAMYDKYDKFSLVPVFMQSVTGSASFGTNAEDRIVTLNISGLPFTNNTYNSSTLTNSTSSVLNIVKFLTNSTTSTTSYNYGNILTFTKNQELVNLNIFYQRINKNGNGNYSILTTSAFPDCIFTFNIYGIDKHDRVVDLNSSRMFGH